MSRAVIAPATWGPRRERRGAARGLVAGQDLPLVRARPVCAEERATGAGGREFLDRAGPLVRNRRRIGLGKVDARTHCSRARQTGLRHGAPSGALAVRTVATRPAGRARAYANDLPGPLWFARPAPARRKDRGRAVGGIWSRRPGRAPGSRSGFARGRRPSCIRCFETSA